jgi:hypothetical protein
LKIAVKRGKEAPTRGQQKNFFRARIHSIHGKSKLIKEEKSDHNKK